MITPERAPVRPRVKRKGAEASFLLEEEIAELAAAGKTGIVVLCGSSGAGKTTAIRHLAAALEPTLAVQLLDPSADACGEDAAWALANHALVVTTAPLRTRCSDFELELLPWTQDEWIDTCWLAMETGASQ